MNKITVIVQARMSSTRLPGKISMDILGSTLLERMIERLKMSVYTKEIIIALSINPSDNQLEELCKNIGVKYFRGNENDLLDRHYKCALEYKNNYFAKIPSDCPLIDYRIIDDVFEQFLNNKFDYFSNLHPATFPDGNDVEVFTFKALEKAYFEAKKPIEREHTTPYFWENSQIFNIGNFKWQKNIDLSMSHRFTIDYLEDYLFIKKVFEELYPIKKDFSLYDILNLLSEKPEIYNLNKKYAGVNWYRNHLDELKTINKEQTKII